MRAVGESLGLGRTFPEALLKALEGCARTGTTLPALPGRSTRTSPPSSSRSARPSSGSRRRRRRTRRSASASRTRGSRACSGSTRRRCARAEPLPGRLAVDSCAAEFEARTPYYYLSLRAGRPGEEPRGRTIVVLGSGPNRIGQGIEFDYCCTHAAQAFRRLGYEAVLLNSNPETVSTDYDTSDRLYLEPVTLERVLDVVELEQPLGVVVSSAGRRRSRSPTGSRQRASPLLGDPLAGDRRRRGPRPLRDAPRRAGIARTALGYRRRRREEARAVAEGIGYPVLVRPHYVLGGRRMRVVRGAGRARDRRAALVDQFLEGAIELDVDVLCDGEDALGGRRSSSTSSRAGVHSGDSACVIPGAVGHRRRSRSRSARSPRGSRARFGRADCSTSSSPCATASSRARGEPARVAHRALRLQGARRARWSTTPAGSCSASRSPRSASPSARCPTRAWAKEAVFPADRFAGAADRGAEMRSTGEVMAGGDDVVEAYGRALRAAGRSRSRSGNVVALKK